MNWWTGGTYMLQLKQYTVRQVIIHRNWTRSGWWIKCFWLDNYTQLNLNFPVRLQMFSVNFSCFAKRGCTDGFISHLNQSYQTKSILKARMNECCMNVCQCWVNISSFNILKYAVYNSIKHHLCSIIMLPQA